MLNLQTVHPEMTLREFSALLHAELRRQNVTAYDLALIPLQLAGLETFERSVQHLGSCPKTVRRIFSQGVRMCMDSLVPEEQPHLDTLEVNELTTLAGEAKVDAKQALSALLRYGNLFSRVKQVLLDIRALVVHECRVTNPTGLFVRLMRSGENVQLPSRVSAGRVPEPCAVLSPPPLGTWVKFGGDWLQVEAHLGSKVRLYAPEDGTYHDMVPGADTDVTLEVACGLEWSACAPGSAQTTPRPELQRHEVEAAEPQVSLDRLRAFTQRLKAGARH